MLDTLAEGITGQRAESLHSAPALAHDLSRSPIVPLRDVLPIAAASLRDDPEALEALAELIAHDALPTWLAGIAAASEAEGLDSWPAELGRARHATLQAGNDTHPGATGDSLRDLVDQWVLRDDPVLAAVAPHAAELLDTPELRRDLADAAAELHAVRVLEASPEAAVWLASVALDGGPPNVREPSVLFRFVRVLAVTNAPIECELDLWLTSFRWSWDNLAVQVLELVAQLEPGDVQGLAGVLELLGDNVVTEAALELAIDSGTCPTLTHETLDDLAAVAWLQEPEALPLLEVLGPVLAVASDHQRLPAVADAVTAAYDAGGVPPLEEFVRDAGPTLAAGGTARFVGVLARPTDHGLAASPSLEGMLAAASAFGQDADRVAAAQRLVSPLAAHDASWQAVDRLADVLAAEGALADGLDTLRRIQAADPDLTVYEPLRVWLTDPETVDALLELLAHQEVVDALLTDMPSDEGPAPLGWVAERLVDGSLGELLDTLATLLHDAEPTPESP